MKKSLILKVLVPAMVLGLASCSKAGGSIDTYDLNVNIDTRGASITMWSGFGSDMSKVLEKLLTDFTNKTGITVSHEGKGGYDGLLSAMNLSATKGSYPNVAIGYPDHFATYIKQNIILRLDGLIENDHKRYHHTELDWQGNEVKYGEDGIKLLDYDSFYDDYKEENETLEFRPDGTPYILGVPFNKSTEVMVINKDFFDFATAAANQTWILEHTNNVPIVVPETWDQVKTVGNAILDLCDPYFKTVDEQGNEIAKGKILATNCQAYDTSTQVAEAGAKIVLNLVEVTKADFKPFTYDSQANMIITAIRQWGGKYTEVDTDKTGKGYVVFQEEANVGKTKEALDFLQGLFDDGVLGIPETYDALYCSEAFKAYKSVMNVGSSGGLKNSTGGAMKVDIKPIPYKDAEHKYVISQGTPLGMFNRGTEKERVASWKLICYLSQQANGEFASKTGYFPSCEYAKNSMEYQSWLEQDFKSPEDIAKIDAATLNNGTYLTEWIKYTDPGFRGSADIRQQVGLMPGYMLVHTYTTSQLMIDAVIKKLRDYIRK